MGVISQLEEKTDKVNSDSSVYLSLRMNPRHAYSGLTRNVARIGLQIISGLSIATNRFRATDNLTNINIMVVG